MTANDSKSYFGYLNRLVDEYNNTYHHSVDKKPIDAEYFALSEGIETNTKAPNFKVGDTIRINKYKSIFSKGFKENLLKEIIVIDSVL